MHKKILLFTFSLLMMVSFSMAQENGPVKWYSFSEAVELNKENPKKIFVDVYTDWCGWCKKMDKATFANEVIADYMNTNFYPVKLDAERTDTVDFKGYTFVNENPDGRRSSHQLAQALLNGRMSYPSYVFLNEENEVITVVPGFHPPERFEAIIHYFGEDAFKNTKWEEYNSSFEGTIESSETE